MKVRNMMRPNLMTWLCAGCLAAATGFAAEPAVPAPVPWDGKTDVFVPQDTYYRCVLRTAADAQTAITLHLALRDNAGRRAYVLSKLGSTQELLRSGDAKAVKRDGAKLAGTIVLPNARAKAQPGESREVTLTLDATIEGLQVTGALRGQWDSVALAAALTGVIEDEHAIRKANLVAPDKTWPAWAGPTGDFRATAAGHKLVDDLFQAKLAWASEEVIWGGRGSPEGHQVGGYASPIVAGGYVFLNQFEGSGDVKVDAESLAKAKSTAKIRGQSNMCVGADDIVWCFDAATGQLVWKQRMVNASVNGYGSKHVYLNKSGAYADGKIYMFGYTWRVYCLDAKTGKLLWHSDVGKMHQVAEQLKAKALAERVWARLEHDHSTLDVADGMPFCDDMAGQVIGFDPATGKIAWSVKATLPTTWTYQGKPYILAARNSLGSDYVVIEPKTGKELIDFKAGEPFQDGVLPVSGAVLLSRQPGTKKLGRLQAHKLTLEGATALWKVDEDNTVPLTGQPVVFGQDRAYIKTFRTGDGKSNGKIECRVLTTGKLLGNPDFRFVGTGYGWTAEGRVVLNGDSNHTEAGGLRQFRADTLESLNSERWLGVHEPTCGYEVAMVHPYADGRIFFRGMRSLVCYDLRSK